jgi:hypothetical protein
LSDFLNAYARDIREQPCKVGIPKDELSRINFCVKNTFVEFGDDEEERANEDGYALKTCPPLQFHSARFLTSDQKTPMKVELPSDFLDADSLRSLGGSRMSEKSTSVGSESDAETGCSTPDVTNHRATAQVEHYSQGSVFHESGTCEPCAWFWRPDGCRWGQNCVRCHLCPEGETKMRKKQKLAAARAQRPH